CGQRGVHVLRHPAGISAPGEMCALLDPPPHVGAVVEHLVLDVDPVGLVAERRDAGSGADHDDRCPALFWRAEVWRALQEYRRRGGAVGQKRRAHPAAPAAVGPAKAHHRHRQLHLVRADHRARRDRVVPRRQAHQHLLPLLGLGADGELLHDVERVAVHQPLGETAAVMTPPSHQLRGLRRLAASSRTRLARSATGTSTNSPLGNRRAAPPAESNAATTSCAQAISSSFGVNTSCSTVSWRGWIADLPKKPSDNANWACSRRPVSSSSCGYTLSMGRSMPAAREAITSWDRTYSVWRFPLPALRSRCRSTPPMARCRTPGTRAMSYAANTPRALSIARIIGLPGARSATQRTSSGDSVFGIRIPCATAPTASRSAAHKSVPAALTRTHAGWSTSTSATSRRALSLWSIGTASSRSSITASAPASKTLVSSFSLCPGANK